MAKPPSGRRSILGRLTNLAIGTALTAVEVVDDGMTAVADANRRVWETVDRVTEPLVKPLDDMGVTAAIKKPVTAITDRVEQVTGTLEARGRSGLILGNNAVAYTIDGIINSVLDYLSADPDVTALVNAQVERILPVLGQNPAVQQLVRQQVEAILPQLANDPQIQALIRAQAGQYIQYLNQNPDQVQPLIRAQGDTYIDYLNAHPASVQNLVQGQSLSLAGQMRDEVRERTVTGDSVVDAIVRGIFRMRPREELPAPDADIQRRAESGKLTSDFVKGRQNGNG
mgnify:CR=1 FL=1